jgi:phosphoesterase RecJ-like protein
MTQAQINSVLSILNDKKRFLITSHLDPDGDSLGCQLALYRALEGMGKQAVVINQGNMPSKYRFLDRDNIIDFNLKSLDFSPEAVIILECPSIERMGDVRNLIPGSAVIVNIDHHPDNVQYGDINLVDIDSSALGETLFLIFQAGDIEISADMALLLYAAIVSDTGRFRFGSTTARCMEVAARLIEKGADPKLVADSIYSDYSPQTIRLLGNTLAGLKLDAEGKLGYVTITRKSLEESGADMENSEGFVDYTLTISGILLGIMFKEISKGRVKVSVRSQNGFDAAAFARLFEGGGHVNAAGFTARGSLDGVIERVLARARELLHDC